jgi:hypothetical protein
LTPWPYEWERRIDDLEDALVGAYPYTRGDKEWEKVNSQLADAMKVVEAAREWHRADYGSATEFIADAGLNDAVIEYNAKHGAK